MFVCLFDGWSIPYKTQINQASVQTFTRRCHWCFSNSLNTDKDSKEHEQLCFNLGKESLICAHSRHKICSLIRGTTLLSFIVPARVIKNIAILTLIILKMLSTVHVYWVQCICTCFITNKRKIIYFFKNYVFCLCCYHHGCY